MGGCHKTTTYPIYLVNRWGKFVRNCDRFEPLWQKASTIVRGESVCLAVEVVSPNWHDDYAKKLEDYENLGIREYWIVDYRALGGRRYIGSPKQPTVSVHSLESGEYQLQQFREGDAIASPLFPELSLIAETILTTQSNSTIARSC